MPPPKKKAAALPAGAVKSGLRKIPPMLASLSEEAFEREDWIYEIKHDGYRAAALVKKGSAEIYSRNMNSFNDQFPAVVKAIQKIPHDVLIDGEIAILDQDGISRFQLIQNFLRTGQGTLVYYVFDLLHFDGYSLTEVPLDQRKNLLARVLPEGETLRYSNHFTAGLELFEKAGEAGLEGIIAKKKDSRYLPGKRTKSWLKIKTIQQEEIIIGGFSEAQGNRHSFRSILTGIRKNGKLIFRGKVGTGFNNDSLKEIYQKMKPLITDEMPFQSVPSKDKRNVKWIEPRLVAQVKYSEITNDGIMRHPVFLGLREDKTAEQVTGEKIIKAPADKKKQVVLNKVAITNPGKLFWKEGVTKLDVAQFYDTIADTILPHLKDRPQSMYRTPNGAEGKGFFQKNVEGKVPDWIATVKMDAESTGEITYLLCQNKETLMYMANLGCIEINPWMSRYQTPDEPDFAVFDLDPLEIGFDKVVEVALKLKKLLDKLQVPSHCKTSGSDGLHIYVPLGPGYSYEQSRQFVRLIEGRIHSEHPEITSLERMPSRRKQKVYLDFLQNGKGKTMSSVYSLRPRKKPTVSTPLEWSEVNKKLDPSKFTITSVPDRIAKKGDIWKDIFTEKIDMLKVLERFSRL